MLFLHSNGIIHRDLKPDNLLLISFSTEREDVREKLSDLGASKNAIRTIIAAKHVGTPVFIAPEVFAFLLHLSFHLCFPFRSSLGRNVGRNVTFTRLWWQCRQSTRDWWDAQTLQVLITDTQDVHISSYFKEMVERANKRNPLGYPLDEQGVNTKHREDTPLQSTFNTKLTHSASSHPKTKAPSLHHDATHGNSFMEKGMTTPARSPHQN